MVDMEYGKCRICGKNSELTFEHIPPRGANNHNRVKIIREDDLIKTVTDENREPWNYDFLKYKNEQRGMGLHSLCSVIRKSYLIFLFCNKKVILNIFI